MFRQAAGIAESDDIVTTDRRLAEAQGRLELSDDERAWVALLLGHDAGTGAARDELTAGWRQAFERMSRIAPLVLVFEDLQWADDGLVDFIEELHDRSRDSRILIVTLSRPELRERRPDWGAGRRNFVSIDLEPLSDEAMIALMDGLAPGLPRPAVSAIVERAAGVPLYAVETVRMLVGQGRLVAKDGRFTVSGRLDRLEVPETLHGLIAARIDALPGADRDAGRRRLRPRARGPDRCAVRAGRRTGRGLDRTPAVAGRPRDPASGVGSRRRPSVVSTGSSRRRSGRSRTPRCRSATAARSTWPPRRSTLLSPATRPRWSGRPTSSRRSERPRQVLRRTRSRSRPGRAWAWRRNGPPASGRTLRPPTCTSRPSPSRTDPAELAWSRLRSGELARPRGSVRPGRRAPPGGDRGRPSTRRSRPSSGVRPLQPGPWVHPAVDDLGGDRYVATGRGSEPGSSGDELAAECAAELVLAYLLLARPVAGREPSSTRPSRLPSGSTGGTSWSRC